MDNAGKSTVVQAWLGQDTKAVSPTFGFVIRSLLKEPYLLNIWDIGGQKTIRAFWRNYFEQTEGLVWVVDSVDPTRLEECRQELEIVLREDRIANATLLILANKQDLEGAMTIEQISLALNIDKLRQKSHCLIIPCSAINSSESLEKGLQWLIQDISTRLYKQISV